MKLLFLYWLIPLWTFTSVQQEIRSTVDGQTEILNAKVEVIGFSNKICFIGKITECHYIIEQYKNEYTLADRVIVRVLKDRIIYNDDYEVGILYKEKRFEN